MMKTAEEMRTVANEIIMEKQEEARKSAEAYADDVVMTAIEEEVKKGYKSVTLAKPNASIEWQYLRPYIESFGYKVGNATLGTFRITW